LAAVFDWCGAPPNQDDRHSSTGSALKWNSTADSEPEHLASLVGLVRIERNVGAASLKDAQHAHHHVKIGARMTWPTTCAHVSSTHAAARAYDKSGYGRYLRGIHEGDARLIPPSCPFDEGRVRLHRAELEKMRHAGLDRAVGTTTRLEILVSGGAHPFEAAEANLVPPTPSEPNEKTSKPRSPRRSFVARKGRAIRWSNRGQAASPRPKTPPELARPMHPADGGEMSSRRSERNDLPPGTACCRRHATAPFLSGHKAELALTARTV
jgi:hypothetical protein